MADLLMCVTCGTQFDCPYDSPLKSCRICDDPRQYVPPGGPYWTSLAREKGQHKNVFTPCAEDPRVTFLHTEPKLGIGGRAIFLQTAAGNVLWDMLPYLDEETITWIKAKGGLAAIVISHPHFYGSHVDWAKAFHCPVYTAEADAEWLSRAPEGTEEQGLVRHLIKGATTILPAVTAIVTGGHFDGSTVLHWGNKLFTCDSIMVTPSGLFLHDNRQPGTTTFSFMYSYPNNLPLHPDQIHGIWTAVKDYAFSHVYGGFMTQDVIRKHDLRAEMLESMKIYLRLAAHGSHPLMAEEFKE